MARTLGGIGGGQQQEADAPVREQTGTRLSPGHGEKQDAGEQRKNGRYKKLLRDAQCHGALRIPDAQTLPCRRTPQVSEGLRSYFKQSARAAAGICKLKQVRCPACGLSRYCDCGLRFRCGSPAKQCCHPSSSFGWLLGPDPSRDPVFLSGVHLSRLPIGLTGWRCTGLENSGSHISTRGALSRDEIILERHHDERPRIPQAKGRRR